MAAGAQSAHNSELSDLPELLESKKINSFPRKPNTTVQRKVSSGDSLGAKSGMSPMSAGPKGVGEFKKRES